MSDRDDILQGIREALKTAFTLTDAQVIGWASGGVRPPLPYVTVRVANHDRQGQTTHDWTVYGIDGSGDPTQGSQGPRTALVEIEGYGRAALGWLEDWPDHVQHDLATIAELVDAGLTVSDFGAPVDLSELLDTEMQARSLRTLTVTYEHVGTAFAVTEMVTVDLTETFESSIGPGYDTTVTIDPDNPPS